MSKAETHLGTPGLDAALHALHGAIDDVPVEGFTPDDLAAALLAMAASVGKAAAGPIPFARRLMDLAEQMLALGEQKPAERPTETAHRMIGGMIAAMSRVGMSDATIRYCLLGYVAAWLSKAEGKKGAEALYRYADAMVGRERKSCH